jgi:hypothetical protein
MKPRPVIAGGRIIPFIPKNIITNPSNAIIAIRTFFIGGSLAINHLF